MFLHQDTLVKGLSASEGSGNRMVRAFVEIAAKNGYAGRVFGIIDGDGELLAVLASQFDAPHAGPLFAWKAYSIESLFIQFPWPMAGWGPSPNWKDELAVYTPYVAINRLRTNLSHRLQTLRLDRFWNPVTGQALETTADVVTALEADKGLLTSLDVASEFMAEVTRFNVALASSLEEGLVLLNGKWLTRHFLIERLGGTPDSWTGAWISHAEAIGGLPAVRNLWERITGSPP